MPLTANLLKSQAAITGMRAAMSCVSALPR